MRITLYCIGSLKENYWKQAVSEYQKRLGAYCEFQIVEIDDLPCKEKASEKEMEAVKEKEGEKVLAKLKREDYLIALDLKGKQYESPAMAEHLQDLLVRNGGNLSFLIGGSLGISQKLLDRAQEKWCFGLGTFPHQLARVMLLEQVYRCFKIIRKEPYHK